MLGKEHKNNSIGFYWNSPHEAIRRDQTRRQRANDTWSLKVVLNTLLLKMGREWTGWNSLLTHLKIVTKTIQFRNQKVDVLSLHSGVRDDISEEVRLISERLVADHQRAGVHHSRFELGGDLVSWWTVGVVRMAESISKWKQEHWKVESICKWSIKENMDVGGRQEEKIRN